jgi:hypothetical protein
MRTVAKIIPYIQSWYTLPDISSIGTLPIPTVPSVYEEFIVEYTEAELRQLILSTDQLFYGLEIDATSLTNVPNGWVVAWYNNIRYHKPTPDNIMPLRLGNAFTTSPHALAGYVCMSALLKRLYELGASTVNPTLKAKADFILRLLKQVNYCIWAILKKYPSATDGRLIIGTDTTIDLAGNGEEIKTVYFDQSRLSTYVASGKTLQQALDYWTTHLQQPT